MRKFCAYVVASLLLSGLFACLTPTKKNVKVQKNTTKTTKQNSVTNQKKKRIAPFHSPKPPYEDLCNTYPETPSCVEERESQKYWLPDEQNQWYDDFYKDLKSKR